MESFEDFRASLIRRLALQLGITVEERTTWEIWVAIHEECPEAARIASDQWLERDLLVEHLRYDDCVRNSKDVTTTGIVSAHALPGLIGYVCKWQQFNLRIQTAIARRPKVDVDYFLST
jgi:hypothetical protein